MNTRHILLLGAPRVELNRRRVHIQRRKALALLGYLVTTRQPHPRETLAALLWPEQDTSSAFAYLRNALWTLNKALGEDWTVIEGEFVSFNANAGVSDDLAQFEALLADAARLSEVAARAAALERAVGLVRGEFLAGFALRDAPAFDDWRVTQAEAIRRRHAEALEQISECTAVLGDYPAAIAAARRWLALDTLNEAAHRQLMRLYAWSGEQAAAIRQYREVVRLFESELGTAPDPLTTHLYEAIQSRRLEMPSVNAALMTAAPSSVVTSVAVPGLSPTAAVEMMTAPAPEPMLPDLLVMREAGRRVLLPAQTTPFVGRSQELAEIARLLQDPACHLLTLVGQGGIGKTRLAIQAAADFAPHAPDGVTFISLVGVCYPEYLVPTILTALQVIPSAADDPNMLLMHYLRDKQALLVLDNFEHLLDSAAVVSFILAHAPQVKILATSRERLNLHEEYVYETAGLRYPRALPGTPEDAQQTPLEDFSAVRLFVQSARRARPDFALYDPLSVARICQLVEGLPLGIELAASWVQLLSCAEIAAEIERGLDILATTMRNVPERHRSLRAVFEYTWDQLTPHEQKSLKRLSVFQGGFQQEAALSVAEASLYVLRTLVDKSLLRRDINGRYAMHELLRQYAEGKLTADEADDVLGLHAEYHAEFLFQECVRMKTADEPAALLNVEREIDNLRRMWYYAASHRKVALMRKAIDPLSFFFTVRSRLREGLEIVNKALHYIDHSAPASASAVMTDADERLLLAQLLVMKARCESAFGAHQAEVDAWLDESLRVVRAFTGHIGSALTLIELGLAKNLPGRINPLAQELAREGLAIYEAHADRWGTAYGHYAVGAIMHNQVLYADARRMLERSLALYRQIGQPSGTINVLDMLSENAFTSGHYERSRLYATEIIGLAEQIGDFIRADSVRLYLAMFYDTGVTEEVQQKINNIIRRYEEQGEKRRVTWMMYNLAWNRLNNDQFHDALVLAQQVLPRFREMGDLDGTVWSLIATSMIHLALGEVDTARATVVEALALLENERFPWGVSGGRYVLGELALLEGDLTAAAQHFAAAVHIAYEVQSLLQSLRHLGGFAAWLLMTGQTRQAVALATFVLEHPVAWIDTLKRCRQVITAAEAVLQPEAFQAAQAEGRRLTLDSAVAWVPAPS